MLTVEDIQKATCEHFSVSLADMKSRRRSRSIVLPRQVAMFLCRRRLNLSFEELGERFGRDHTTVMSAVKRIENHLSGGDPNLVASDVQAIEAKLDRPEPSPPKKGQTIMRIRVDGALCYAVGLTKEEAVYLKQHTAPGDPRGGLCFGLLKKFDWVIETAERDERWARERAAGKVPNV